MQLSRNYGGTASRRLRDLGEGELRLGLMTSYKAVREDKVSVPENNAFGTTFAAGRCFLNLRGETRRESLTLETQEKPFRTVRNFSKPGKVSCTSTLQDIHLVSNILLLLGAKLFAFWGRCERE